MVGVLCAKDFATLVGLSQFNGSLLVICQLSAGYWALF
jgi:hypothetical protein